MVKHKEPSATNDHLKLKNQWKKLSDKSCAESWRLFNARWSSFCCTFYRLKPLKMWINCSLTILKLWHESKPDLVVLLTVELWSDQQRKKIWWAVCECNKNSSKIDSVFYQCMRNISMYQPKHTDTQKNLQIHLIQYITHYKVQSYSPFAQHNTHFSRQPSMHTQHLLTVCG